MLWLDGNAITDVSPLEGLTSLTSLTLSGNPISDLAPLRRLKAANPDMSIDIDIDENNNAPVFTAGTSTTRSIAENTASGVNIGSPIAATDADTGDTLTYTLGGTDAASFRIVSTSGQLRTNAALDYETKSSYSVSVSVSDGNGGSDSIAGHDQWLQMSMRTAHPRLVKGIARRGLLRRTPLQVQTSAVRLLRRMRIPATHSRIPSVARMQVRLALSAPPDNSEPMLALNYESKSSYSVSVSVSDGNGGSDSIPVTINVTNVNEAPTFATTTATRSIAENTATNQNIGAAFTATDVDSGTTLAYSIPTTGDAAAFSIDSATGQLKTKNALNYESKNSYTVVVTASDGNLTDTVTVTISVTNVNEAPAFASNASISTISATQGTAITSVTLPEATDPDANATITYTVTPALPAGLTFTASTRVLSGTPTAVSASTTYTYTASDSTLSDTLTFTIQVNAPANRAPTFTDGTSHHTLHCGELRFGHRHRKCDCCDGCR